MSTEAPTAFHKEEFQQVLRVLPFVDNDNGSLDLWSVDSSGDRNADIALGEQYAETALHVARMFQMPAVIAMIMRDMVLSARFGGVEAGFVAAIASAARVGSYN